MKYTTQNDQWIAEQLNTMRTDNRADEEILSLVRKYYPTGRVPKGKPLIGLDIDGTLTFSKAQLHLAPAEYRRMLYVTEIRNAKPFAYMTAKAYRMLNILQKNAHVTPVTSRGLGDYKAITVFDDSTPYAVLNTGGRILVNGEEDREWSQYIDGMLHRNTAPSRIIEGIFNRFTDAPWFHQMTHAWPDFVQIGLDKYTNPPLAVVLGIRDEVEQLGWQLSHQGGYLFAIPKFLSKRIGFEEIVSRIRPDYTITAGDSTFDIHLLEAGDYAFRPNHGELATHEYYADNLTVTDNIGVLAGEEILARILALTAASLNGQ